MNATAQSPVVKTVHRRTFEALQHAPGGKRCTLNRDPLTSEYFPSHKFMTRKPALMSDGSPNPAQQFHDRTFRSKREAELDARIG